jgi:glycylpeptide N-tetradecanoyltransferase
VTEFNEDEFAHWFLPRKNIIDTFVVENDGQVTDMVSFYTLPSTVMSHPAYDR